MNQALVQDVVSEVMRRLGDRITRPGGGVRAGEDGPANDAKRQEAEQHPHHIGIPVGQSGVFTDIDQCVVAAGEAQKKLVRLSLEERDGIVKLIKSIAKQKAHEWGKLELDETKIGRLDHKIEKLQILEGIPGVEFLKTYAYSGSKGLSLDEFAPFGVIGCITPVTHSIPTLTCNAINMIAAGNALVINAHPSGANCAAVAVREYNRQISANFGIDGLVTCVVPPSLESAEAMFRHRDIPLLVVTGGAAVARAALHARKRAIVAGPGNPPVVVDETACLSNAAESIVKGAAYDNNLLCIGEKEVFCVESVFDKLMAEMEKHGAFPLDSRQIESLTRAALKPDKEGKPHVNKDFVGKDPQFLADAAGVRIPPQTQLLFGETKADQAFVQEEQMMPFVPFVRTRNVDEAIELALEAEHGFRHTAIIHSKNVATITKFGRLAATTIFVANGSCLAGLGGPGGEGWGSYSIATPTGEGITSPLTFTRFRRVTVSGGLRMI